MHTGQYRIETSSQIPATNDQLSMDCGEIVAIHEAPAHTGLVGHHHYRSSQCGQLRHGLERPGDRFELLTIQDVSIGDPLVEDPIPIKNQPWSTHRYRATPTADGKHRTKGRYMTRPVSLAVVGAGYWGPNLVRNILDHPQTRLRWIVDRDASRAEGLARRHGDAPWTTSLDETLADPDLDAVAIATPAATHSDLAHQVLESGRHVLIEKPLAASLAEGRALAEAAERFNRVLMCDHTYCYTPAVRRLHSAVAAGELGDLHYVDSVRINLGLVQPDVDVFWDLAPHDLSILDLVLPPHRRILTVSAHGADPLGTGRTSVGHLTLGLDGGALAHVHVNWLSPTKVRTSVWGGSKRTLVWDDLDPVHRVRLYDRGVVLDDGPEPRIAYRIGDMTSPALGEREALATMLDEFCGAIEEQRSPLTGAQAGLAVLEILTAAHSSLDEGGIAIPLSGPAPVAMPARPGLESTPTEHHRLGDPLSRRNR